MHLDQSSLTRKAAYGDERPFENSQTRPISSGDRQDAHLVRHWTLFAVDAYPAALHASLCVSSFSFIGSELTVRRRAV